jgi:phage-related baseplate assembly protein
MASPDFSKYVDLTIYDTDAETLLNQIVTYARGVMPEWVPAAGEVEMMLAEVFAVGSADLASYINRIPGGVVEGIIALFGETRSSGVKSTGIVDITMVSTAGYTLPAGTALAYTTPTAPAYVFVTDSDLVVSAGLSSGSVAVTATAVGAGYNSVPASAGVQVLSNVTFVSSAAFNSSGPSGGADAENDAAYFERVTNRFATYSSALATTGQIRTSVLDGFASTVYRCAVYDKERYLDRAVSSTATHPGYVLVAVADQNAVNSTGNFTDVTTSSAEMAAVRAHLEDRVPAGLQIDIMSAEVVSVDVTASVKVVAGADTGVVETAISNALSTYLDPNAWDWTKSKVRVNEVIALIDGVDGVDYVESVALAGTSEIAPAGADNFTLATDIELHNHGTLVGNGTHTLTVS